jgi:flavodoxin
MRSLVVYESMFGNTEQVARAIAAGLSTHMEVDVVPVSRHAPTSAAPTTSSSSEGLRMPSP